MPNFAARRLSPAALLAVVVLAAGCGSDEREVIVLQRPVATAAADSRRLPLSTPPVYWVRPGSESPDQAPRAAVEPPPPPVLSGEDAILRAAGADVADPNIREQLARAPGIAVLPDRALEQLLASGAGAAPGAVLAQRRQSRPIGD